jgi:transcriptional regulator with XRE-family HTH domain
MSTIGQTIKYQRERLNMTQEELARKVRVGTQTIEKYENNIQPPDIQTILKISTVLDIPASVLLKEIESSTSSGVDREMEQLIHELGANKVKIVLRKVKELSDEDFQRLLQFLYEMKYKI